MKSLRMVHLVLTLSGLLLPCVLVAQERPYAMRDSLLSGDAGAQARALALAEAVGPRDLDPAARAALIVTLERLGLMHRARYHAGRMGQLPEPLEHPELIGTAARLVALLEDPEAIPALVAALGSGFAVIDALVDFGPTAAPAVVALLEDPKAPPDALNHGLITLRLMIEASPAPFPAGVRSSIVTVTERHLDGRPRFVTTLWRAMDLAGVLADSDLRARLRSLSEDPDAVRARGVDDADAVSKTMARAADRLAGVPALPRPRR